jgi:hypothetical protein
MKNLHKIGLSEYAKLVITNWHISTIAQPERRVGKIQYKDGRFYVWRNRAGIWERDIFSSENYVKDYLHRKIPVTYFKDDMVYYE